MRVRLIAATVGLLLVATAPLAQPAGAWTQVFNNNWPACDNNPAYPCAPACGQHPDQPCSKYDTRFEYERRFFYTSTFNPNWKSYYQANINVWNSLRYKHPLWYEQSTSTGAMRIGSGPIDPFLCAAAHLVNGAANYISVSNTTITLSSTRPLGTSAGSPCFLQHALAHEHGHAGNGFGHTSVVGSLMVPNGNSTTRAQQDEFNGLAAIYGSL